MEYGVDLGGACFVAGFQVFERACVVGGGGFQVSDSLRLGLEGGSLEDSILILGSPAEIVLLDYSVPLFGKGMYPISTTFPLGQRSKS